MARIASLLNPYFEKETPAAVRKMEMEDWAEELRVYPQWAIENAVRWWKSKDNPKRSRRPVEGDISEICHIEMEAVRAANIALRAPIKAASEEKPEEREEMTDEMRKRADEMVAEFARQASMQGKGSVKNGR